MFWVFCNLFTQTYSVYLFHQIKPIYSLCLLSWNINIISNKQGLVYLSSLVVKTEIGLHKYVNGDLTSIFKLICSFICCIFANWNVETRRIKNKIKAWHPFHRLTKGVEVWQVQTSKLFLFHNFPTYVR